MQPWNPHHPTEKGRNFSALFRNIHQKLENPVQPLNNARLKDWIGKYLARLQKEELSDIQRKQKMNLVNPKYVLRNYMSQIAIEAADKGDYTVIDELYFLLKKPYDEQIDQEKWFAKRPEWARTKVGCSMLSCSS